MEEEELTIRLVGKIALEFPTIDQKKLRNLIEITLNDYEISTKEKSLVASDIPDRVNMYLAVKKLDGLSHKTLYNYKIHLEKFCSIVVKPVRAITTTDIRIYLAMLLKSRNIKQTTLATEISILKSFFSWLTNEEYIEKNPMIKIKSPKKEKRLRKSLNVEELERLRDSCKTKRERALLEFLFSTGCRLSELVSININDINWENQSIHVIGKGDKERVIYFSPKTKLYLKKYLHLRNDNNKALFVGSRQPHNRLGNRAIEKEINKIATRANFDKAVFPHLLRHTMATLALQSGAALTTVQKLLGHTDPGTTEIYAEISDENVKSEYRKYLIQ